MALKTLRGKRILLYLGCLLEQEGWIAGRDINQARQWKVSSVLYTNTISIPITNTARVAQQDGVNNKKGVVDNLVLQFVGKSQPTLLSNSGSLISTQQSQPVVYSCSYTVYNRQLQVPALKINTHVVGISCYSFSKQC